jgi:hypothetical protein
MMNMMPFNSHNLHSSKLIMCMLTIQIRPLLGALDASRFGVIHRWLSRSWVAHHRGMVEQPKNSDGEIQIAGRIQSNMLYQ